MDLKSFYNDLKSEKDRLDGGVTPVVHTAPLNTKLGAIEWKGKVNDCAKQLTDDCCKHIIVDMYCRILPFDPEFIQGNKGMMKADVDNMLASKGMSATQYLQSCANNTKAPMCEYVYKMCNLIGKQFMEEANEKLKEANEKGLDIPAPGKPDAETDEQVTSQLIDIKNDPSYATFMANIEDQTKQLIVDSVAKILTDKKQDKDMAFAPKDAATTESATEIAINSIQARLIRENIDCSNIMDDIMGLAIREAALNVFDDCFRFPKSDLNSFKSRMRFHKGAVVTESAVQALIESANKSTEEVEKVVDDANAEKDKKINSKLSASDVLNAKDDQKEKKQTRLEREEGL